MIIRIVLFVLALPINYSYAADACPTARSFYDEIMNCDLNSLAVAKAQICADTQLAASRATGEKLQATLLDLNTQMQSAQKSQMGDAMNRLKLAITVLERQIKTLQQNTSKVAAYTESMIDFSDGTSDETSAECFSKNFHALQKIVNSMDNEILNSKKARQSALSMYFNLKKSSANLGLEQAPTSTIGRTKLKTKTKDAIVNKGHNPQRVKGSDISGSENLNTQKP